jgi:tetratricopeptide (TPR) repeat protein
MNEAKLNKLLHQAEQAAQRGDWQSSKGFFQQAASLAPQDLSALNGLASSLLQSGKAEEAIGYFEKVVAIASDSSEAHNNLGVGRLIAGFYLKAEEAFRQAVDLSPDNVQAWKNLSLACLKQNKMEEGVQILASIIKAQPKDIEALYLLGQCYQEAQEYDSARYLYEQALKINPGYTLVKEALTSLPGANVDSARIARAEHAQKLSALKGIKKINLNPPAVSAPAEKISVAHETVDTSLLFAPGQSLAFFGLPELPGGRRVELIAKLLSKSGFHTKFAQTVEAGDLEKFDCFVFSQPHISPDLISGVMACIQAGKRFVVDIDQDYHNMPEDHPAYAQFGQGNANGMKALKIMLQEADWVSAPSAALAERMALYAKAVKVIPPMWDQDNSLWEKPKLKRAQVNLGWMGTAADRPDLLTIKSVIEDCMKKIPQAQLVIAGDSTVFEMFDGISESRRLYLPAASPEDIPYVLSQFDILLIPLRDNLFNQAKSDLPLLEAGVLRIPWVAAPIPAFMEWKEGGLLAESGEWCESITRLVNNEKLRIRLGESGRIKAENRERYRISMAISQVES